ncbi:hypothetical protein BC832DRAFT_543339 [Gaertneriomyces semiglobifer]|nr:hypothetical protein BC832DRAFT_543339 [Gaertneriomyces semiglobifer]
MRFTVAGLLALVAVASAYPTANVNNSADELEPEVPAQQQCPQIQPPMCQGDTYMQPFVDWRDGCTYAACFPKHQVGPVGVCPAIEPPRCPEGFYLQPFTSVLDNCPYATCLYDSRFGN